MKKLIAVLAVLAIFFSAGFVCAKEKKEEEKTWKVTGEVSVGMHSEYVDEISGGLSYNHPVSTQSAMIGVEKDGTGFYLQAENFVPLRKKESKETDLYLGFYTEAKGFKFDVGYAYYWVREKGESDYHALYGSVDFPSIGWEIVPFFKAEYRFATRKLVDEDGNRISLGGFVYQGGLKREFKIHEKVSLVTEVSVGGNTGVHGYKADNLAFARGKAEVSVNITEELKLKLQGFAQRNLGRKDGIAEKTNGKAFLGIVLSYTW